MSTPIEPIDVLAFEFFREFARCEYCLKAVGLREHGRRDPTADWGAFAAQLQATFTEPESPDLKTAVQYYVEYPPKKQVLRDGLLDWASTLPDHENHAELILRLVCRVRNNLFHGGKFNGHWFRPQRSETLLRNGLIILHAAVAAHPAVRNAYADKAT
jgi:hypothetical protein